MKTYSLEELTDKHSGRGRAHQIVKPLRCEVLREMDLLGKAIKDARKERHLTQEQLGELVG